MAEPPKNKIPPWADEPLAHFISSVSDAFDFYHLTIDGLKSIISHHELLVTADARLDELVIESGGKIKKTENAEAEEKTKKHRQQIKKRADLAQREVSNGFPVLHSQHVVSIWSAIECFVEDVLVAWLTNDAKFIKSEQVQKVKIPLAAFDKMNQNERNYFLVSELQRDRAFSHRNEIEKFESLLELAGLSGNIEATIKRDLIELGHVRNVLLHRRGIADAKFVQACPWLTLQIGERVRINPATVDRYLNAAVSYSAEIVQTRMIAYFEVEAEGGKETS